jgi:hypothetical protein
MLARLIQKIKNKNSEGSLCDVKTNSYEETKQHIITQEHKENVKVEELTWKQIYEDILFIA